MDSQGKLSPSSFIPFCDFGGNMSVMGVKIDHFKLPVCNKFKPRVLKGQLCFQVDVNEFQDQIDMEKGMKKGLIIVMDYNFERVSTESGKAVDMALTYDLQNLQEMMDKSQDAMIYIETLGRVLLLLIFFIKTFVNILIFIYSWQHP